MIVVIHKACSGPALETDTLESQTHAIPADDFPFTCFTCLDEIFDEGEIRFSEEIRL
jgi:hypothetical protein